MGNDRLEEEDDGVDEEDGESEVSIGGIGSRLRRPGQPSSLGRLNARGCRTRSTTVNGWWLRA